MKQLKFVALHALYLLMLFGCGEKDDKTKSNQLNQLPMMNKTENHPMGTVLLLVRLKSELTEEELLVIAKDRAHQFRALPGLIQKYYVRTQNPGEYMGVYIWDSMESLKKFRESELAATIAKAYKLTGPPTMEVVDIMFGLRE